ncbi:MAG: hypothetical protein FWD42_06220, partial [Solirubrobacterales bacterium]|nr:hypothetical protein [Solirubrobacterales bacterium]
MSGKYAVLLVAVCAPLACCAQASAETPAPGWEITSAAYPTDLKPGHTGIVVLDLSNTGGGASTGKVTVTDALPPGLEATLAGPMEGGGAVIAQETAEEWEFEEELEEKQKNGITPDGPLEVRAWGCVGATVVTCETVPGYQGVLRPIEPGFTVRLGIKVHVAANASEAIGTNHASVSGGGAPEPASSSVPLTIASSAPPFGIAGASGWLTNASGTTDMQAGSHPYEATFNFGLNAGNRNSEGALRNLSVALPPGIIGDPQAVPRCTRQEFVSSLVGAGCPPSTQVGVDWPETSIISAEGGFGPFRIRIPVYNLVPPPGVAAEFGFSIEGKTILLDATVRSGGNYGITANVGNIAFKPTSNTITIWGRPSSDAHNAQRCGKLAGVQADQCGYSDPGEATPFLTLPTACEGPQTTRLHAEDWSGSAAETSYTSADPAGRQVGFSGCELLSFGPSMSVAPDTSYADTPAGLTVELKAPQEGLSSPEGLSTSNIKDTTVTLPEGVVINPGQAAGLAACQASEDGLTTEAEKALGREDDGPAKCPNASKVGTDEIETPLLAKPLKGNVYVLQGNPPHLKLLVTAEGDGVFLKLLGSVSLDEQTGRLTTTFDETPELPFTTFKLAFSGGAQAALDTPTGCGEYTTTSDFMPWSTPFVEDVAPSSTFAIEHSTGGGACPAKPLPFAPSMTAGSTTDQAGGYTDFSMLLTRPDDQQRVSRLQFRAPEGLLGMISTVPLCQQPDAARGECPGASQIGHAVVESGPGPYPLVVPQPGQPPAPIYLTGPYQGAPFGLSIVVPLHVGPFVLETQVTRAKIDVDPQTAQVTVTTDPLPQHVDGVPTDLRSIDAVIDRPGFMFNPTDCSPMSFSGTATSNEGAQAALASHFQMGSCQALKFKPGFEVSTSAKTSRTNGASLTAKVIYPAGNLGANQASSQSNVAYVKVELPKQLPSRLSTLQKACTAQAFAADPASCPSASRIGEAKAITPVLPVPLTGPAYFVSNGSAKFPELIVVLQGYGVHVDLHGETFISKAGITSSTFAAVPDVPIYDFELNLPEGPYSALAANGDLCAQKLTMPTTFVGHNGAQLHQNTAIAVEGCKPEIRVLRHSVRDKRATIVAGPRQVG